MTSVPSLVAEETGSPLSLADEVVELILCRVTLLLFLYYDFDILKTFDYPYYGI